MVWLFGGRRGKEKHIGDTFHNEVIMERALEGVKVGGGDWNCGPRVLLDYLASTRYKNSVQVLENMLGGLSTPFVE